MISALHGNVDETIGELQLINVQGVGYGVYMTLEDRSLVSKGQSVKVYIYEHIREQAHDLFAFLTLDTKKLFEQLLGVNGVGPKMALSVLGIASSSQVRQAIANGDTKMIQQASGVGKRVAERIIVDLKDKVGLIGVDTGASGLLQADTIALQDEAVEALVSLGYSVVDAVRALQDVDKQLPTESRIKLALTKNYGGRP